MTGKKKLKVGVTQGGGPPPGYTWSVVILDEAYKDAVRFLNPSQYRHMAEQVKELARQNAPSHSELVDVRSIEKFHEIRDSGGPLGPLNVRIFFSLENAFRTMLILGAIKKQNNGKTPQGDKVTMRRRLRKFRNGDFGTINLN